jgi:hypothetical protein
MNSLTRHIRTHAKKIYNANICLHTCMNKVDSSGMSLDIENFVDGESFKETSNDKDDQNSLGSFPSDEESEEEEEDDGFGDEIEMNENAKEKEEEEEDDGFGDEIEMNENAKEKEEEEEDDGFGDEIEMNEDIDLSLNCPKRHGLSSLVNPTPPLECDG